MRRASLPTLLASLMALIAPAGACQPDPTPTGPPRCESPEEALLDRQLKDAFKALARDQLERAEEAFLALHQSAPGHPDIALGLELLAQKRQGQPAWIAPNGTPTGDTEQEDIPTLKHN